MTTTDKRRQVRQPWMSDMKVLVSAPVQLWCGADGTVDGTGERSGAAAIDGLYVGDTRVISRLALRVDGEELTPISWSTVGLGRSVGALVARCVEGPTVDPAVRVDERRTLTPDGLEERLVVTSTLGEAVRLELEASIDFDMATMQEIKGGAASAAAASGAVEVVPGTGCGCDADCECGCGGGEAGEAGGVCDCVCGETLVRARFGQLSASIETVWSDEAGEADATPEVVVNGLEATLRWQLEVPARGAAEVAFRIALDAPRTAVTAASAVCPWRNVRVSAADTRVSRWANTSLRDLAGLRLSIPTLPDDTFLAAGAPWFFTLFGRDSLWAARFLLPLDTTTAMGTLRTLAHFQATASDPATNADPGKIMHELRAEALVEAGAFAEAGGGMTLPPLYYGTIDATPLWIILLAEAARWGAPEDEVKALLPNLEAALAWLRDWGDCDGDGFLEYIDRSGHGLSNQGWKDSGDSVRWRDGRIAEGPIALCEVQGYAYQAAILGADLLERFGRLGADEWRAWAGELKTRFNEAFWVDDGRGRYPAIALDAAKRPVDSLTSNIGHLLGTGILDEDGVRDVVARLSGDDMLSGFGVRTMSSDCGGYSPLSYHCGSVWAHDSAIVMNGLLAEGHVAEAVCVAEGLVRAAEAFGYQIPELYSGDPLVVGPDGAPNIPAPYPAACHPQAWSAASSVAVLALLLGLDPNGAAHPLDTPLAAGLHLDR